MPAAVAIPLVSTAVGVGAKLYSDKKQRDAQNAALAQQQQMAAAAGSSSGGGGGSSSYSGGSHSESRGGTVIDPEVRNLAFGGASDFLKDGGLSQEDLASMRSRALSPIRAAYSDATREINRTSALQGGYSPNRTAALSRMARERGQGVADAATNAEAGIVGMRQQGKIAGLNAATSMYANMPTFSESFSDSWNSGGSSSGGSGGGGTNIPTPTDSGGGFWNTLGNIGRVALPIGLNAWDNMKGTPSYKPEPIPNIPYSLPGSFSPIPAPGGNS